MQTQLQFKTQVLQQILFELWNIKSSIFCQISTFSPFTRVKTPGENIFLKYEIEDLWVTAPSVTNMTYL